MYSGNEYFVQQDDKLCSFLNKINLIFAKIGWNYFTSF